GGAEIAADVLARCTRVVADSPEQARTLSRELIEFYGESGDGWTRVRRLADVVANGERRTPDDELTVVKSLGMGVSDLARAIGVYRAACRAGAGRRIDAPQPAAPRVNVRT